ncbi:GDSL-type esterase/lipase family protein [Actinophytocola sp.]|uniref:SGNH/GDSL hydrolase family protein n=1 Tax=Actinophytocola sp. TaxID=1872138 RepID=UPI0025C3F19F|nr:GDSL-type esterase/lipase family protein [Actinophytocola sp.]
MRYAWLTVPVALVLVVVRAFTRFRRPPANNPAAVLARASSGRPRVVCLGASTVHGNISFNWVDELARRLPAFEWVNAGINGETSAQVLDRLPDVVACTPGHVVVQVGGNDLLARDEPLDLEAFTANLTAIVAGLRATGARIALLSFQPPGERPDSPVGAAAARLAAAVRRVAADEDVAYLPLPERLTDLLARRGPTGKGLAESSWPFLRARAAPGTGRRSGPGRPPQRLCDPHRRPAPGERRRPGRRGPGRAVHGYVRVRGRIALALSTSSWRCSGVLARRASAR